MISKRTLTGANILEYRIDELNNQVELLSLYEAKTLKNTSGTGSFDDIPIVDDDHEIIVPFYKEFHAILFPVLSTVLLQTNPDTYHLTPDGTLPNIQWNIANGTMLDADGVTIIADPEYANHHLFQTNMLSILDVNIESGYKYYALFKWFMTQNVLPELAQKYLASYQNVLSEIKSNIRHNNNSKTRTSRPYNMF